MNHSSGQVYCRPTTIAIALAPLDLKLGIGCVEEKPGLLECERAPPSVVAGQNVRTYVHLYSTSLAPAKSTYACAGHGRPKHVLLLAIHH